MKKVKKTSRMRERAYLLPSLLTVSSLFAGYLSIVSSIKGEYVISIYYILAAFFLDGLDGGLARKLNVASDFGREFDSLCDLVAFGVAPAILVWQWSHQTSFNEFAVLVSFIFVAGGAIRLARFNVTTTVEPKSYFIGLPIPAAAASLSSVVYAFPNGMSDFWVIFVLLYTALLGGIMVSTFRFPSIKKMRFDKANSRKLFLYLSGAVALAWKFHSHSVFIIMMCYICIGIMPSIIKMKSKTKLSL